MSEYICKEETVCIWCFDTIEEGDPIWYNKHGLPICRDCAECVISEAEALKKNK